MQDIAFEICQRVVEAQALIHDHVECGKHTTEELVARLRALFEERALLQQNRRRRSLVQEKEERQESSGRSLKRRSVAKLRGRSASSPFQGIRKAAAR